MKDTIKLIWSIIVLVILLIIFISVKSFDYNSFSIEGVTDCERNCSTSISVKTVLKGTQTEYLSDDTTYGASVTPQICEDYVVEKRCNDLNISTLSDYATVTPITIDKPRPINNYSYLNKYVQNSHNNKVYFLYTLFKEGVTWVYEEPLKIISYDIESKKVNDEGKINTDEIRVRDMHISPLGNYIVVVGGDNPRYTQQSDISSIIVYDLKSKETNTLIEMGSGSSINFMSWIDDTHFFYKTNTFNSQGKTTFKIGTIK